MEHEEIKKLDDIELSRLADELRNDILNNTSHTGGHLASNLGVVELTIALHRVFDTKKDKIVWDVGHQCYVHKMLTGRSDRMDTLRCFGGISGFPKLKESIEDAFDSGHASTSVSAALGYAAARDLKHENYSCIAIIGDGALTGGVAYEALNAAGSLKTPIIVILNDNEMSIGSSVGGIAKHLQTLRASDSYLKFKEGLKSSLKTKKILYKGLRNLRNKIKYMFLPGVIFEELGFKYFGPIDGHDIGAMCGMFEKAKQLNRPVLVHVVTKKGKGYAPAENNPSKYHGTGPFDLKNTDALPRASGTDWSECFGNALLDEAEQDDRIIAISAAMTESVGLGHFAERFPERVFDVGIAEQHAVSFAEGLALNGMKPVVAIYSTFLQRAYDQMLIETCEMNLPVVFAIDRSGVTGNDGETHQGTFNTAYLSSMPGMTIFSPCSKEELSMVIKKALSMNTPCAICYPKGKAPESLNDSINGSDSVIICDGASMPYALEAAKKTDSDVIHLLQLKPLDLDYLNGILNKYKTIVTLEDASIEGGLGMHIASMTQKRILVLAWPDRFIEHGSIDELRKKYGLDPDSIAERITEFENET